MGSNYSKQVSENTQKAITEVLTTVTNEVENVREDLIGMYNFMDVDFTQANMEGCEVSITQNNMLTNTVLVAATTTVASEVTNDITNKLNTIVEQALQQTNSGINLGQANTADTRSKILQEVKTVMQTQLNTQVRNVLKTTTTGNNTLYFRARYLTCRNSKINIQQGNIFETISQLTADTTVENIVKNKVMNDIAAAISQKTEQVNKGIDFGIGVLLLAIALIGIVVLPKIMKGGAGGGNLQDAAASADPRMRAMAFIKKHKVSIALVGTLLAILIGILIWLALIKAGVAPNVFLPAIAK